VTIFSPVSAQDWRTGLTAFEAVDYTLAQKVWIPLAEAVDASSQESLWYLYGLAVDFLIQKEAAEMYRLAADQGFPRSQNNLDLI
jgi:TPR repeat protein